MREAVERKIEINGKDHTFRVTPMGARQGRQVLAKIVQLLGGAVAGIASAANGGGKDSAFAGLESFARNLEPEQIEYLCDVFEPLTQVKMPDGKVPILKDVSDDLFACQYWAFVQWLAFCLEVNYGSFLGGNGTLAGLFAFASTEPSKSGSPQT